ncbi:MAG: hypothetical protein ACRDO1_19600 [Nocardioidaceae bacterium]
MTMTQPPPLRELPPDLRERTLRRAFQQEPTRRSAGRRVVIPLLSAAAVAAVLVGVLSVVDRPTSVDPVPRPVPASDPPASTPPERSESLNRGPISAAERKHLVKECSVLGSGDTSGKALYGQRIRIGLEDVPVLVLQQASGAELLCTTSGQGFIKGAGTKSLHLAPNDVHPIWAADGGGGASVTADRQGRVQSLEATGFYRVTSAVDRIEIRVGSSADPGPWRSSEAVDGFVFIGFDHSVRPGQESLRVELRAFDDAGERVGFGDAGTFTMPLTGDPRRVPTHDASFGSVVPRGMSLDEAKAEHRSQVNGFPK